MRSASSANSWPPSSGADDASNRAVRRLGATCLIGALLRADADLALREDCAQDALVAAMQHWPAEGWPERPGAWLMTSAKHRLLDRMRDVQMAAREQPRWVMTPMRAWPTARTLR